MPWICSVKAGELQVEIAGDLVPAEQIEAVRSLLIIDQIPNRQRRISILSRLKRTSSKEGYPPLRVRVRQWIEQNGIDHRKYGGGAANPNCEGENRKPSDGSGAFP